MFKEVNPLEYVDLLFAQGKKSQKFIKKAVVTARPAKKGEVIVTMVKNKETKQLQKETEKTANAGDWVITNVGGEVYTNSAEEFEARYIATSKAGEYLAKATPRTLIQIDEDITFPAPWGGAMNIQAGGWLNLDGIGKGEIYGINPQEFEETHIAYDEKTMGSEKK